MATCPACGGNLSYSPDWPICDGPAIHCAEVDFCGWYTPVSEYRIGPLAAWAREQAAKIETFIDSVLSGAPMPPLSEGIA